MKTADEWATYIIAYMQQHPVKDLAGATQQIKDLVEMIQKDAVPTPTVQ